jgi:hypothetical protein
MHLVLWGEPATERPAYGFIGELRRAEGGAAVYIVIAVGDESAAESPMALGGATPDENGGERDEDIRERLGDGAPSYDGLRVCQWE